MVRPSGPILLRGARPCTANNREPRESARGDRAPPSCRLARMWEALALTAALCQVLRNAVMKRLGHELDEYMAVWGRFTFLLPFAALFVLWHGAPAIKPGFVWACLLFAVCQIISTMALSKALKLSPISMV